MKLGFYFLPIPLTFNSHLRRNVYNKSSMDLRNYFRLIPLIFNSYLRGKVEHKSPMDLRFYFLFNTFKHIPYFQFLSFSDPIPYYIFKKEYRQSIIYRFRLYFLLFPLTFNTYLNRNKHNKSSLDLRLYFLKVLRCLTYLKRNIDNKRLYFLLFPSIC